MTPAEKLYLKLYKTLGDTQYDEEDKDPNGKRLPGGNIPGGPKTLWWEKAGILKALDLPLYRKLMHDKIHKNMLSYHTDPCLHCGGFMECFYLYLNGMVPYVPCIQDHDNYQCPSLGSIDEPYTYYHNWDDLTLWWMVILDRYFQLDLRCAGVYFDE